MASFDLMLEAVNRHSLREQIEIEACELVFTQGFENYNRDALIITGEYGQAEVSPLSGYFSDLDTCIGSAMSTVTQPWPEAVRTDVETNIVLTQGMALDELSDSYTGTIKVKISSPQDYERVARVRDRVGGATIRVDCNGIFDVETASMFAKLISPYDIEYIEQPCSRNDECARVNIATDIPIALDESVCTREQIEEALRLGAGDILVVKIQPMGGLQHVLGLVHEWDKEIVVSSMMESHVGLDVGFALARAIPTLTYACGLSSVVDNVVIKPLDE